MLNSLLLCCFRVDEDFKFIVWCSGDCLVRAVWRGKPFIAGDRGLHGTFRQVVGRPPGLRESAGRWKGVLPCTTAFMHDC